MEVQGRQHRWDVVDSPFDERGAVGELHEVRNRAGFVYKRYKEPVVDPGRVRNIRELAAIGARLIRLDPSRMGSKPMLGLTWSVDLVETGSTVVGVVMPRLPSRFLLEAGPRGLDGLHLPLADPPPPSAEPRIRVLLRLSEILAWLDREGWVHGDISGRNVVWCEGTDPQAVLIDVDEMSHQDRPSGHGLNTMEWTDPRLLAGQIASHDLHSDRHALALAAFKVLAVNPGYLLFDGKWHMPEIPDAIPPPVSALLEAALHNPTDVSRRAPASEWVETLRGVFFPTGRPAYGWLRALDSYRDIVVDAWDRRSRRRAELAQNPGARAGVGDDRLSPAIHKPDTGQRSRQPTVAIAPVAPAGVVRRPSAPPTGPRRTPQPNMAPHRPTAAISALRARCGRRLRIATICVIAVISIFVVQSVIAAEVWTVADIGIWKPAVALAALAWLAWISALRLVGINTALRSSVKRRALVVCVGSLAAVGAWYTSNYPSWAYAVSGWVESWADRQDNSIVDLPAGHGEPCVVAGEAATFQGESPTEGAVMIRRYDTATKHGILCADERWQLRFYVVPQDPRGDVIAMLVDDHTEEVVVASWRSEFTDWVTPTEWHRVDGADGGVDTEPVVNVVR